MEAKDWLDQKWSGMDGATAYHLIERHAPDWDGVGEMMDAWLAANAARLREPAGAFDPGARLVIASRTDSSENLAEQQAYVKGWNACRDAMLASAPQPPAEAQAQGGGEVVATIQRPGWPRKDSAVYFTMEHAAYDLPPGTPLYAAPPSAPVGVEAVREIERVISELRAYNPAADEHRGAHIHKVWAKELATALTYQPAADRETEFATIAAGADCPACGETGPCGCKGYGQQPAAVDGAMVERMVEAFLASTGQQHSVTQLQRDLTTECMKAALAAQPGGSDQPQGGA